MKIFSLIIGKGFFSAFGNWIQIVEDCWQMMASLFRGMAPPTLITITWRGEKLGDTCSKITAFHYFLQISHDHFIINAPPPSVYDPNAPHTDAIYTTVSFQRHTSTSFPLSGVYVANETISIGVYVGSGTGIYR